MKYKLQFWILLVLICSIFCLGLSEPAWAGIVQSNPDRVLSRLSFGITSEQLKQVDDVGIEAYIESQLNPQSVPETPEVEKYLSGLKALRRSPIEMDRQVFEKRKILRNSDFTIQQQEQLRKQIQAIGIEVREEAQEAQLVRAIYSNRQLQEVMVDFWFNHFNVFANKGDIRHWINDYANSIRDRALGNFGNLLATTAKHPAMLIYLDNARSIAPNSPVGIKRQQGLNENYARELMELHTLGVDGGYTQEDIIALARIFTGWTTDSTGKTLGGFVFNNLRHDPEAKIFLGQKILPNGMKEGEQALDILAHHPATARHISYKLAQYFVADEPPTSLVDKLTQKFLESEGEIATVMDALIHSEEFNDPQYYGQKFTTPYQYVVSLVRMAEIEQPDLQRTHGILQQLSMPIFACTIPTGYLNVKSAWLNPQAMLQRTSYALTIANGILNREFTIQQETLKQNMGELSPQTKQVISQNPPKLETPLIMGSPEAMYR